MNSKGFLPNLAVVTLQTFTQASTNYDLGKTDLPRVNSSKISRGKFILGFVLPR